MRNLILVLAGIVFGFALFVPQESRLDATGESEQTAPVQVEVRYDRYIAMYDCWPAALSEPQPLVVYLNYPAGTSGYVCVWAGGARFMPLLPHSPFELAHFQEG